MIELAIQDREELRQLGTKWKTSTGPFRPSHDTLTEQPSR